MERPKAKVRRTPGCERCKSRKIKCDAKPPACGQCRMVGKECPGTGIGLIFINSFASGRSKDEASQEQQQQREIGYHVPRCNCSSLDDSQWSLCQLALDLSTHYRTPMTLDPWLMELPRLSLRSEHRELLASTMRGLKLAFDAKSRGNHHLTQEATLLYTKALFAQRKQLSMLGNVPNKSETDAEAALPLLMLSMLLLHYEMLQPSSSHSWCNHAIGAISLLRYVDPRHCQASPFRGIYIYLRTAVGYISVLTKQAVFLGEASWIQRPFRGMRKRPSDQVVDLILQLPHTLDKDSSAPSQAELTQRLKMVDGTIPNDLDPTKQHPTGIDPPVLDWNHATTVVAVCNSILVNTAYLALYNSQGSTLSVVDCENLKVRCAANLAAAKLVVEGVTPFSIVTQVMHSINAVAKMGPSPELRQEAASVFGEWEDGLMGQKRALFMDRQRQKVVDAGYNSMYYTIDSMTLPFLNVFPRPRTDVVL